jgi:hypothetical protein
MHSLTAHLFFSIICRMKHIWPDVDLKSPIFWDITACSPLKVNGFSEKYIASNILAED